MKFLCYFFLFSFLYAEEESILKKILKNEEMIISVAASYEPYYIANPKKGFPGFEVEIAEKYAEFLGVKIGKIIPLNNFAEHAKAIEEGTIDIALGNSTNLARIKQVYFSDPYEIVSPGALVNRLIMPPEEEGNVVLNKNFRNILDLKNISRITFGVKDKTSNVDFIKNNFEGYPIITFKNDIEAVKALKENRFNCYVADNLYLEGLLQKESSLKVGYLPLLGTVTEKQLSFAFKKYDVQLQASINLFIREMKRTGEIERLKQKYFYSDGWVKKN
ncbi:MAG: transporter substrate-binding domain-containing protein [Leptospiraceae bacterium]|nr:transporter substrate-binding domain-containing protein [Leptospiraceae bacterium]